MSRHTKITVEEDGTNVYADLGYSDAAEMQRKSQLAAEIARAIKARRLTQHVKIVIGPVRRRAGKIELQFT